MLDQQDSHLSFEERLRARYRHHDVPSTLRPQHAFSAEQAIATFETILRDMILMLLRAYATQTHVSLVGVARNVHAMPSGLVMARLPLQLSATAT